MSYVNTKKNIECHGDYAWIEEYLYLVIGSRENSYAVIAGSLENE